MDPKTYTQEEVDALVTEKLAALKGEQDEAFKNLWNEAKEAKARLKEVGDVDEVKALRQRYAELEQQKKADKAGITAAELERLRAEVRQDLEKEYAEVKSLAETLRGENRELKLDNVVKNVMGKAGVRPERIDSLYKLVAHEFDLTDDGKPMLKNRMGTAVDKWVTEDLVKEYPEWFLGSGSSGGGASKSTSGASGTRVVSRDDSNAFLSNIEGVAKGSVEVR